MGYLGEADITAMLAEIAAAGGGVRVSLGSTTVAGLRDHEAVELLGGEMPGAITNAEAVHVATDSLPGLTSNSTVQVDGVDKKVVKALAYGDGALTRIELGTAA